MKFHTFILYLILSFYSFVSISQTTFNREMKIMNFISSPGSVLTYEDTIICIGHGTDFYSFRYFDFFVAKFDLDGNLIERKTDTLGNYQVNYINDAFMDNDKIIFALASLELDDDGFWGSYLIIMDVINLDIIKKIPIVNPDLKKSGSIKGLTKIDSVTYAIISVIDEKYTTNGKQFLDQQIAIINIETEEVKYIQLGKKGKTDIPEFIVWNGKKFLIGTYNSSPPFNPRKRYEKRVTTGLIYEVDTSGIWDVAYLSDTMRGSVRNLLINKDGDYICTSNYLRWYNKPNTNDYIWHVHKMVFKLDKDFNLIWEKPYGLQFDFNWHYDYAGILPAEEGDGYILAGYQPNFSWTKDLGPWNIEKEIVDSMKQAGNPPMLLGTLHKISEDGDSIWARTYSTVRDTNLNTIEHTIHDITYAPDGGYVLYGDITYSPRPGIDTAANFHGWLLKVDKDGCFVPGCGDTIDTTNLIKTIDDKQVMIYPNPTSGKLYVYQPKSGHTQYTITNISGREKQKWSGSLSCHTYIIDISKYKPGMYILNVSYKNLSLNKTYKFIVEK